MKLPTLWKPPPASVHIGIDRDATIRARKEEVPGTNQTGLDYDEGPTGVVATFLDRVALYRAVDPRELGIIKRRRAVSGGPTGVRGTWASVNESRYGASWTLDAEDAIQWGEDVRWVPGERYLLEVKNARGMSFYSEWLDTDPKFDPQGPAVQKAQISSGGCSVGLGCSLFVDLRHVTIHNVVTIER